ncbi:MAG: hypothetical protein OEY52_02790 [Gammaproteobacteria bacterium]|nr:hypothetical protein [Gammaproteobacteria bacterium]
MGSAYFNKVVYLVFIIFITSCSSDPQGYTGGSASGVVIDDYLAHATVCLDVNLNKKCDSGESTATTNSSGAYTLSHNPASDLTTYPLLVEVIPGTTLNGGKAIAKKYVLNNPPGEHAVINPLSTLVSMVMNVNPALTKTQAEEMVKKEIGYSSNSGVSLFNDFLKETSSDYKKIHGLAQVLARTMGNKLADIETAATSAGLDVASLNGEIIRFTALKILENINSLAKVTYAEVVANGSVTATAADTLVSANPVTIDTSKIKHEIEAQQQISKITKVTASTLVQNGMIYPDSSSGSYEYDYIKNDGSGRMIEGFYTHNGSSFVAETTETKIRLSSTHNWIEYNKLDSNYRSYITENTDGTVTVTRKNPSNTDEIIDSYTVAGSQLSLSGQKLRLFVNHPDTIKYYNNLTDSHVFSDTNSKGIRWSFTQLNDTYNLFTTSLVRVNASNATATAMSQIRSTAKGTNVLSQVGSSRWIELVNGTDTNSGTAHIYSDSGGTTTVATANWSASTVGSHEIIKILKPVAEFNNLFDKDSPYLFFALYSGTVRAGGFIPTGYTSKDQLWSLNEAAFNEYKTALSL